MFPSTWPEDPDNDLELLGVNLGGLALEHAVATRQMVKNPMPPTQTIYPLQLPRDH